MGEAISREVSTSGWDAWSHSWEMRFVGRLPAPPVAVGVAVSLGLIAIYLVVVIGLGESIFESSGAIVESVLGFGTSALVTGYALAAGYAFNASNARAFGELRPHLRGAPTASGATLAESRIYGAIGVLAGIFFLSTVDEAAWGLVSDRAVTADAVLSLLLVPLPFWLFARAAYFALAGVSSVSAAAESGLDFDLLDRSPVVPVGRMALRGALLWIGAAALASLSIVLTGGSLAEFLAVTFLLIVAAASFLLPVRGVRRRFRERKAEELARTRAELRRDRRSVAEGGADSPEAAARLPGLIAWEARIEAVPEWPFDTPTLVRFALYLLIPLGSWLGGALVERSVDVILD